MITLPAQVPAPGPTHVTFPDPAVTTKFEDVFGITWVFLEGMWSRYIDVNALSTTFYREGTLTEIVSNHPEAVRGDFCEVFSEKRIYINTGGTDPIIPSKASDWIRIAISISQYDDIATILNTLTNGLKDAVKISTDIRSDIEDVNKVSMVSNKALIDIIEGKLLSNKVILSAVVAESFTATANIRLQDNLISANSLSIGSHNTAIAALKTSTHTNGIGVATNITHIAAVDAKAIDNGANIGILQTTSAKHETTIAVHSKDIASNLASIQVLQPLSVPDSTKNTTPISARWAADHIADVDPHIGYQKESEKGDANGYAPLDSSKLVPTVNLPASVLGSRSFKGTWNAATNVPILTDSPTAYIIGDYFLVSVTGATDLGGVTSWLVSDKIIYGTSGWEKINGAPGVSSVNTLTGAVVLNTDKIPEGITNLYHKDIYVGVALDEDHMIAHTQEIGSMVYRPDLGATFARQANNGIGNVADWLRITPDVIDAGTY